MVCIKPISVINPKTNSPMYVPCGRCMACRINKTQEWVIRLEMEKMTTEKTSFVTLTYDDNHLPKDQGLHKKDLQLFFKRLRKLGLTFRYYAVGEYGEKEQKYYDPIDEELIQLGKINPHGRPHYHVLFFGQDFRDDDDFLCLQKAWFLCSPEYWIIHRSKLIGDTSSGSIRYVCDYMQKKQYGLNSVKEYWNSLPPFSLNSQKLGLDAFDKNIDTFKEHGFIMYNGHKCPIPRYFREKRGIEPDYKIRPNNFYRVFCLEHGIVSREDLPKYDYMSEQQKSNLYFFLVRDKYKGKKNEEMEKTLRKRNFLYSEGKL